MTAPIATGFPDWSRRRPNVDAIYLDTGGVTSPAGESYGPFYVGDVSDIGIYISVVTFNVHFVFTYTLDQAGATSLGEYSIDVAAGGDCQTSLPVRGSWLQVQTFVSAPNAQYSMSIFSLRQPCNEGRAGAVNNVLLWQNGAAFAAGATIAYNYPGARPGPANISALWRQLGAGYCQIYSLDYLLNFTTVAAFNMAISSGPPTLYLPATPIRVIVHNSAAGAQTLDFALTAPYSYLGA